MPFGGRGAEQKGRVVQLEIQKLAARHLPKADLLGKCDPFLRLEYGESVFETEVKKGVYDAEWDEKFVLDIASNQVLPLKLFLLDYDNLSSTDNLGSYTLDANAVTDLINQAASELNFEIQKNGKPVKGKDGGICVAQLSVFRVDNNEQMEEKLEVVEEENDQIANPDPPSERNDEDVTESAEEEELTESAEEEDATDADHDERRAEDQQQQQGPTNPEPASSFPGKGRRLGSVVDNSGAFYHQNWTKRHPIVLNSDKTAEARLRSHTAALKRQGVEPASALLQTLFAGEKVIERDIMSRDVFVRSSLQRQRQQKEQRQVPEPTYFWRQPGEELEQRDFIDRQKQPTKSRNETSNTLEDLRIEKGARSRYRDDDRRWGLETKRDDEGELTRISKAAQSVLRQNGGTEGWEVERRFEDSNRGGVASRSERQLLDRVNALLNEDFGYEQQHRGDASGEGAVSGSQLTEQHDHHRQPHHLQQEQHQKRQPHAKEDEPLLEEDDALRLSQIRTVAQAILDGQVPHELRGTSEQEGGGAKREKRSDARREESDADRRRPAEGALLRAPLEERAAREKGYKRSGSGTGAGTGSGGANNLKATRAGPPSTLTLASEARSSTPSSLSHALLPPASSLQNNPSSRTNLNPAGACREKAWVVVTDMRLRGEFCETAPANALFWLKLDLGGVKSQTSKVAVRRGGVSWEGASEFDVTGCERVQLRVRVVQGHVPPTHRHVSPEVSTTVGECGVGVEGLGGEGEGAGGGGTASWGWHPLLSPLPLPLPPSAASQRSVIGQVYLGVHRVLASAKHTAAARRRAGRSLTSGPALLEPPTRLPPGGRGAERREAAGVLERAWRSALCRRELQRRRERRRELRRRRWEGEREEERRREEAWRRASEEEGERRRGEEREWRGGEGEEERGREKRGKGGVAAFYSLRYSSPSLLPPPPLAVPLLPSLSPPLSPPSSSPSLPLSSPPFASPSLYSLLSLSSPPPTLVLSPSLLASPIPLLSPSLPLLPPHLLALSLLPLLFL